MQRKIAQCWRGAGSDFGYSGVYMIAYISQ